jgi:hypothetical protein
MYSTSSSSATRFCFLRSFLNSSKDALKEVAYRFVFPVFIPVKIEKMIES